MTAPLPRSYLYVPGGDPAKLSRALDRGADALIVDLEDAVPLDQKASARGLVAGWLAGLAPDVGPQVWVRVNPGPTGADDLAALAGAPALVGVVPAKASSESVLAAADQLSGSTLLMPLVETASAVLELERIAAVPRVVRLQVGEVDLAADLGAAPGEDELELLAVRSRVVLVSAAAGLDPPVGAVSTDFRDLDRFARGTARLRRLGFFGRACIHPAQLSPVHAEFTPTDAELRDAAEVVAAFDSALARGEAVAATPDGRMIDPAVVRRASRVLAQPR